MRDPRDYRWPSAGVEASLRTPELKAVCHQGAFRACTATSVSHTENMRHRHPIASRLSFDLDDKFPVPGYQYIYSHKTYEKDGYDPHWRGIYADSLDSRSRIRNRE